MAYTPQENGLILFDRLISTLTLIEFSDDNALADLRRRIMDAPTISGELKQRLRHMIIYIMTDGVDGDRA